MRKKILYIIVTAAIALTAFSIGKYTAKPATITKEVIPENYVDISAIVDWNTDENELSVITEDNSEYYAYKTENIYSSNNNIEEMENALSQIEYWEIVDDGIDFYTYDGNIYEWR